MASPMHVQHFQQASLIGSQAIPLGLSSWGFSSPFMLQGFRKVRIWHLVAWLCLAKGAPHLGICAR